MRKILAPLLAETLLNYVDEYIELSKIDQSKDICDLVIETREFERLFVRGLHDRVYKIYPYDATSKTAQIANISSAKVRYLLKK